MKTKTRGQALTEFALILPLLLLLLLGIIEGARIAWAYITVQEAAREAARYAVTGQPYDDFGNPWTLRPDRVAGCDPHFDGQLTYSGCSNPNDRVDAIIGVALQRSIGLGVERYAIQSGVYTATGYYDVGGTYGVRVISQEFGNDARTDFAGKEGLNVLVQVYYNVKILDPLYGALVPNGYVRLLGEVQMQNEGIDQALGGLPPAGIAPPEAPEGAVYQPGQTNPPVITSLDGSEVEAGADFRVKLEHHTVGQEYDVYLVSGSSYVKICSALEADAFGSVSQATCTVPADTAPGTYQLVSIETGASADPANHVAEGDYIDVIYPNEPILTIVDGNRWPPGSTITFQLVGHQPCPPSKVPCPPYQEYDIALIGGIFPSPGMVLATVRVDEFGVASTQWTIPSNLDTIEYTVATYERDTITQTVASTTLDVAPAQIVIQGGNQWPAGTTIRVHLRGHAANRTYTLRWIDGSSGSTIDFGPVTVDQFGDTAIPATFVIPEFTPDSPPNHRIISFETGGDGSEVASTDVEVYTPPNPFITVVGGNEWPAGSVIQIELQKHFNGPYDLYFGSTLIESNISPNTSGFYQTTYTIPRSTPSGSYEIRTERASDGGTEATTTIDVTIVPLIQLAEGDIVQPGSDITVQLTQHTPNDSFEIYLDGNFLFSISTDPNGAGSRVYDLSNLPGLEGGPFVLESRQSGNTIAFTEIYIMAPDLQVTNIEFPPGPPINVEIPVTVTVYNESPVSVSGEYFDVDLYIDPLHEPTTSSQFPPGDYKRWISNISPTSTAQVVFSLTLHGADHTVFGRVDTSNYIVETDDTNNIYQTTVNGGCAVEVTDALDSAANWTEVDYGDTDIPPSNFNVTGGAMDLESDGSSTWGSSDNMYLVYYNPQTLNGDFEVRVRMTEGPGDDSGERRWAMAGLDIRSNVGDASSAKVLLAVANSGDVGWHPGVVAGYRDGSGGASRPSDGPGDGSDDARVYYPAVWLRIVRNGDRFTYYYSDSDSSTPPAEDDWTPHGSVQMTNMGEEVTIGLFNASFSSWRTDTSSFDNFHICIKDVESPPAGEDFPPGLTVCTGDLLQNGDFENSTLSPWTVPNGAVNKNTDEYEGQFAALMYTYITGAHQQPALGQTFDMPEWVISSTTIINLSRYQCVRDFAGSGAEPDDHLNVELRTIASTPISTPTLVADGNTTNSGPCSSGDYTQYTTDLAAAIKAGGGNPEDYAGQTLELYFYDTSSDPAICNAGGGGPTNPVCYETDFRLDNVELEVCTTQPIPPHEPGKATIGGPLRVLIGGAPQPKQGVRVWTYMQNGDLLTTYSLHDSNYFFYNVDPGEYVIYSEYWDGPNLYSAFTTVTIGADETIADLSLLLQ